MPLGAIRRGDGDAADNPVLPRVEQAIAVAVLQDQPGGIALQRGRQGIVEDRQLPGGQNPGAHDALVAKAAIALEQQERQRHGLIIRANGLSRRDALPVVVAFGMGNVGRKNLRPRLA